MRVSVCSAHPVMQAPFRNPYMDRNKSDLITEIDYLTKNNTDTVGHKAAKRLIGGPKVAEVVSLFRYCWNQSPIQKRLHERILLAQ